MTSKLGRDALRRRALIVLGASLLVQPLGGVAVAGPDTAQKPAPKQPPTFKVPPKKGGGKHP